MSLETFGGTMKLELDPGAVWHVPPQDFSQNWEQQSLPASMVSPQTPRVEFSQVFFLTSECHRTSKNQSPAMPSYAQLRCPHLDHFMKCHLSGQCYVEHLASDSVLPVLPCSGFGGKTRLGQIIGRFRTIVIHCANTLPSRIYQ